MTPERWQQIKSIFDAAADLGPVSRMTLIRERCGDDEDLRKEVESLLASGAETSSLLDNPLLETAAMEMVDGGSSPSHPSGIGPSENDSFGPYLPTMGNAYTNFGGQYRDAQRQFERVLEIRRRVLGEEHPDTISAMGQLGFVDERLENYGQAEPLLTRALELSCRVLGKEHSQTIQAMVSLGQLYENQGKPAQAEELFTKALELSRRVLGEEHSQTIETMTTLGVLYSGQRKYALAEPLLARSVELSRRKLGEKHIQTAGAMLFLGALYVSQGQNARAEPLLTTALEVFRRDLGDEHRRTTSAMFDLGVLYFKLRKYAQAEPLLTKSVELSRRVFGEESPMIDAAMTALDTLYRDWGKPEQAAEWRAKLQTRYQRFVKDGNVFQDPDTLVSFRLTPGWTLTRRYRASDEIHVLFVDSDSKITGELFYSPRQGPYPADTDGALRQGMEAKVRQRQGRPGLNDYHLRSGSPETRLVGGHPAISFIGEYTLQRQPMIDYTVQVLGKTTQAEFKVFHTADADIADFCKRFDVMVNTLRLQ